MNASRFGLVFLLLSAIVVSCNKEFKDLSLDGTVTANNEVVSESYSVDVEDLASLAVLSDPNAGGRTVGNPLDDRFECATITRTPGSEPMSGTILIDFGTAGCKDRKGNLRKGKIRITYKGKRNLPGSTCQSELIDYSINDVKLEGVRTITSSTNSTDSRPVFKVTLAGGKTSWPDGTFSTHDFSLVRTWVRASNPSQDVWYITGAGSGITRKGTKYEMKIVKDLVYKKSCEAIGVFIAVSGVKVVKKDAKEITIDYGNDVCNNLVTVTQNGVSKVIEINKKGL